LAADRLKRNLGLELGRKPSACLHAGSSFPSGDPPYAPVSETGTTSKRHRWHRGDGHPVGQLRISTTGYDLEGAASTLEAGKQDGDNFPVLKRTWSGFRHGRGAIWNHLDLAFLPSSWLRSKRHSLKADSP